jgi:methylphosphotriester-DNA--protein-cysteine methyltransferase
MIKAMSKQSDKTINKFIGLARFIAANADASLTLETLAAQVHLSPSRMQRVFKSTFGVSPKKFQQAARSEHFKSQPAASTLNLYCVPASISPTQFTKQVTDRRVVFIARRCIISA